jgi:hypothetical protein
MIEQHETLMNRKHFLAAILVLLGLLLPACLAAQSDDDDISLGDFARSLRKGRGLPDRTVIDNDNLFQIMDEVESRRLSGSLLFSFDGLGKSFQVSSPDVTCSLSFSAQAASLVSDQLVPRDLPDSELSKLEGPAVINGDRLEVSIFNGTDWSLTEITVGLTILRHTDANGAYYGSAKLVPAPAGTAAPGEKPSDITVLYHLKGTAAPFTMTVFRESLSTALSVSQDWHWAIVQAKGLPPK